MNPHIKDAPGIERRPLDLPQLEQDDILVQPTAMRLLSDEKILADAEETNNWDTLGEFEYGVEPDAMSIAALRKRFEAARPRSRYSNDDGDEALDNLLHSGGRFIEAIWEQQRQIPTVGEYAIGLQGQGLLTEQEAQYAQTVSDLTAMKDEDRRDAWQNLDEDEQWHYTLVRGKLTYYTNLQPGALGSDDDPRKLAEEYALKSRAGQSDKARNRAYELILQARGLNPDEVKTIMAHPSQSGNTVLRFRALGIDPQLAQTMADNPKGGWERPNVNHVVTESLSGNLHTQLAVRRYFGIQNLYDMLSYQANVDASHAIERSNDKLTAAIFTGALARGDEDHIRRIQEDSDRRSQQEPTPTFALGTSAPEEAASFEALASFAVHEPALRKVIGHPIRTEMMRRYSTWLDAQTPDREPTAPLAWLQ